MTDQTITSVSRESRVFKPSAEFKGQANLGSYATYRRLYNESVNAPDKFWAKQAKEHLVWRKPFRQVLQWRPPHAKWFLGGKLNVSENCLDRHLGTARENKAALIFVPEPEDEPTQVVTYQELFTRVNEVAAVLRDFCGLKAGDRVTIHMPMIPELPITMLACARLGVVHSVVFGGFSASSLADRIQDSESKVVVTADGGYRRGHVVHLKAATDEAVKSCPTVEKVVVLERVGPEKHPIEMTPGRDFWWHELAAGAGYQAAEVQLNRYDLYTADEVFLTGTAAEIVAVSKLDGRAIGKPGTFENARRQLRDVSGHSVFFHTALCVFNARLERRHERLVTMEVGFRRLSDAEIDRYLEREHALDCAGSAKSEGLGVSLLTRMHGDDPTALVGLPLIALSAILRAEGFDVP